MKSIGLVTATMAALIVVGPALAFGPPVPVEGNSPFVLARGDAATASTAVRSLVAGSTVARSARSDRRSPEPLTVARPAWSAALAGSATAELTRIM